MCNPNKLHSDFYYEGSAKRLCKWASRPIIWIANTDGDCESAEQWIFKRENSKRRIFLKNKTFISSFKNAGQGLVTMLKTERNFKIEFGLGLLALSSCAFFHVTATEWIAVILCCMIVLAAEGVNSAIEQAVDLASPDYHILAKCAKDFAAGSVLVSAFCSAIIGLIIFLPYILQLF